MGEEADFGPGLPGVVQGVQVGETGLGMGPAEGEDIGGAEVTGSASLFGGISEVFDPGQDVDFQATTVIE